MKLFLAAMLLAGVTSVTNAQGRAPVPPPSSETVRQAVAILQSGDAGARHAFVSAHLSKGALQRDSASADKLLEQLHTQGAPFELIKIDSAGRHAFAQLKSPRTGRTVTFDLPSDRDDPTRLSGLEVLESHAAVLDEVTWTTAPSASDSDVARLINSNMNKLAAAHAFSGVVYVLAHDRPLFARGYGYANLEDGIPNAINTRFSMASMGKMFTATAIMQLVDAGKLKLDDTLAKVLPRYPNAERAKQITIRNLLEHSAGMGDIWSTAPKPVAGLTGALAYAGAVAYPPLFFTPGTRWSYSNEGFAVLGAVVEEVSGESFIPYIERHILAPAGMKETSLRSGPDDVVPHRAVGYRPADDDPLGVGPLRGNWSFVKGGAGGAGGGYTTVGDLARFGRALREGKLMSAASRTAMWTAKWDISGFPDEKYGLGQEVMMLNGKTIAGHGGGGGGSGMDNGFRQFTDGSYTVVVLTNGDPPAGTRLTKALVRMLAARSPATVGAR